MKFKAAVLRELNKDPEVEDIEIVNPLTDGQVLVKIEKSGLCGAQLQEISGLKNNAKFLPHLIGHEGFGEVIETKDPNLKVGSSVVMHWRLNKSHLDGGTVKYDKAGGGPIHTLCEYAVVSGNRLTEVLATTDSEIGAMLGCCTSTAYGIARNVITAGVGIPKRNILILGGGGIGLNIALILNKYNDIFKRSRNMESDEIDIMEKSLSKNELITKVGANIVSQLNKKYDIILDTTGNAKLLFLAASYLNKEGKIILIAKSADTVISFPNDIFFNGENGIIIESTQAGGFDPTCDLDYYLTQENMPNPKKIITARFPLTDIQTALKELRTGNHGRIMINT